jgi:hypothetical protein
MPLFAMMYCTTHTMCGIQGSPCILHCCLRFNCEHALSVRLLLMKNQIVVALSLVRRVHGLNWLRCNVSGGGLTAPMLTVA